MKIDTTTHMHKHKCTPRLRFGGSFSSTPTSTSSSRAHFPTLHDALQISLERYHVQAMKAGQEALETAQQQDLSSCRLRRLLNASILCSGILCFLSQSSVALVASVGLFSRTT